MSTELIICTGTLFWCAVSPPLPPIGPVQKVCAVSPPPIGNLFRKHVRCPLLPVYTFSVRCPPPQFSSVPWKLWLCLGFWGKLRIWQVPACKMKQSSTCILECCTPSCACFIYESFEDNLWSFIIANQIKNTLGSFRGRSNSGSYKYNRLRKYYLKNHETFRNNSCQHNISEPLLHISAMRNW